VQLDGEKECHVKLIQAKKYSLALTDAGDMYVWGLRSNFGTAKMIRSEEKYETEVIDIRVSNENIYGLAAEGTLYSWAVKSGEAKGGSFICRKEKVVANGRAVLDFSSGDNYILILGDIVKQIPYSSVPPALLPCYDEIDSLPRPSDNLPSERESVESRFLQETKDNKSSIAESKFSDIELGDSNMNHFDQRSDFGRNFSKMKNNFDHLKPCLHEESALAERKDFNNLKPRESPAEAREKGGK
jgi:hypothetical protein